MDTTALTAKELMTLMDCLFHYERKVEQGLKEASDVSYGWSLLVQEQQHLHNTRNKLHAQLVEANKQGA